MPPLTRPIAALFMLFFVQACALDRSEILPDIPAGTANPASGTAVRIVAVDDARKFEAAPRKPDIPSLREADLGNPAIQSRAIARKRGGFGAALGDIVLPAPNTVSTVVEASLSEAFRGAGYKVVAPGDAGYEQAIPIRVRINEFWSWVNLHFSHLTLSNRIDVTMSGNLPALSGGKTVRNESAEGVLAAFDDNWRQVISKGIAEFTEKARTLLRTGR